MSSGSKRDSPAFGKGGAACLLSQSGTVLLLMESLAMCMKPIVETLRIFGEKKVIFLANLPSRAIIYLRTAISDYVSDVT